uniref:FYVE-type domain-containing protein n=1 Tax=Globisporangium ultimum (strain ATCC 200006 / CBS 805.95 / DAOM BR144) TaxID=431595 RepID=K3WFW5_GLOUD
MAEPSKLSRTIHPAHQLRRSVDTSRMQLSASEQQMLFEEAERVVSETLVTNELFIACDRKLPATSWVHVSGKDNLNVYQARMGTTFNWDGAESTSLYNQTMPASVAVGDLPMYIATEVIAGTIEDVAFGALAHTERLWRHRDAQVNDLHCDGRILTALHLPTPQDPFRSLVLKWSKKCVGPLSRVQDYIYIEANGIAFDAHSERFTYHLVHSSDTLCHLAGLQDVEHERGNISTCCISRQHDQGVVEVFWRGVAASERSFYTDVLESYFTPETFVSCGYIVECSYIKKLVWLMHKKRLLNQRNLESSLVTSSPDSTHCGDCGTHYLGYSSLVAPWLPCQACRNVTCHECSIIKALPLEVSSTEVKNKPVAFCRRCVTEANEIDAHEVAITMFQTQHS